MTPEQFTYWLNGFVELNAGVPPTPEQWTSIKEHLGTVFTKVTPPVGAKDICRTCGAPGPDGHSYSYRHVFRSSKSLSADTLLQDEMDRMRRRGSRGDRQPIPRFEPPGRIC